MHHDIDEVHQDPIGNAAALDMLRLAAFFEQAHFDRIGDRQGLPRRRSMADDEIIGEMAEAAQIEHEDVLSLLVESGLHDLFQ